MLIIFFSTSELLVFKDWVSLKSFLKIDRSLKATHTKGIKAKTKLYNLFYTLMIPLYPLMKLLPTITTSSKLGLAMINCLYFPLLNKYLDNKKINKLSKMHIKN
mgnify:CR=1 FL=1